MTLNSQNNSLSPLELASKVRRLIYFLLSIGLILVFINTEAIAGEQTNNDYIQNWLTPEDTKAVDPKMSIHWKFAHPAPKVSLLGAFWEKSLRNIERDSQQKIQFKIYGGGSLYGVLGGFKAIRSGISDFGTCYSFGENKGFELLKTFHLPFVSSKNPYLNSVLINKLAEKYLSPEFLRKGVYPAHIIPLKPQSLISTTPIKTPQDLKGKKVVSFMHLPGAADQLGYTDIKMPFPEIYTALQQGIIDVIIWSDLGFIPYKIYEQAKFYTELNISSFTVETCFNRNSFDRLPKELKQQVYDDQQKTVMAIIRKEELFSIKAKSILKKNGVSIIQLNDAENSQWLTSLSPIVEAWMNKCDKNKKDCRALVKDIDRLKDKYKHLTNEELIGLSFESPVQGMIKF